MWPGPSKNIPALVCRQEHDATFAPASKQHPRELGILDDLFDVIESEPKMTGQDGHRNSVVLLTARPVLLLDAFELTDQPLLEGGHPAGVKLILEPHVVSIDLDAGQVQRDGLHRGTLGHANNVGNALFQRLHELGILIAVHPLPPRTMLCRMRGRSQAPI